MIYKKNFFDLGPYSLSNDKKILFYLNHMSNLIKHHYHKSDAYKKIINFLEYDFKNRDIEKMPYLPITLFKELELISVKKNTIFKTLTSSGTTSNIKSKIFLDKENSNYQILVLSKLTKEIIGNNRLPMLIVDSKSVLRDRKQFSARGAAILGFSLYGKNITYALDENLDLDFDVLLNFLKKNLNNKCIIFGFTYLLWKNFYLKIKKKGIKIDLSNFIIIHGGGWKKLQAESITNDHLKKSFQKILNTKKIINYYGMVEQTGSIFFECDQGYFHTSVFSEIITRRNDLSVCNFLEEGIVELMSLLPTSYPGHILLTQDKGAIYGVDDCKCGKLGKYFKISGRLIDSELRGCSDSVA